MDGYHAFRDAVHDATPETRLAAFRTHLLGRDPAFASAFMGWVDRYAAEHPEHLDGMIQAALAQDEGIRIYHELLHDTVPTVARDVAAHLDESVYDVPVYLTMSVLSSTAQVRRVEGRPVIMYGLDTLAFFDAQTPSAAPMADLRPLVAHEYFHAWHWTVNPFMGDAAEGFLPPQPDAPVWLNLWSEGLATCFSRILYPEASIQHVLAAADLWDEVEPRLGELAAALLVDGDSGAPVVIERWFYTSTGTAREEIPARAAYAVGLAVAHHVVADHGLDVAARLDGMDLRRAVVAALETLAAGEASVRASSACVPTLR